MRREERNVRSGSNPFSGAKRFGYKLALLSSLTAALRATSVIPNNSKVFAGANLSGWRCGFVGVRAQPPGFSPDPKYSLANSPVSPLDSLRLLTAPSNTGGQEFTISNLARPNAGSLRHSHPPVGNFSRLVFPHAGSGSRPTNSLSDLSTPRLDTAALSLPTSKAEDEFS